MCWIFWLLKIMEYYEILKFPAEPVVWFAAEDCFTLQLSNAVAHLADDIGTSLPARGIPHSLHRVCHSPTMCSVCVDIGEYPRFQGKSKTGLGTQKQVQAKRVEGIQRLILQILLNMCNGTISTPHSSLLNRQDKIR